MSRYRAGEGEGFGGFARDVFSYFVSSGLGHLFWDYKEFPDWGFVRYV